METRLLPRQALQIIWGMATGLHWKLLQVLLKEMATHVNNASGALRVKEHGKESDSSNATKDDCDSTFSATKYARQPALCNERLSL